MSCQPAHPHFPRATRGALNALLRPAVPMSRCISPFEDRDLHPAERGVVKAAKDTQQDDHLQGLRNRCERRAACNEWADCAQRAGAAEGAAVR